MIDCSAKLPADVTEAMFRTMEQQALGQVCLQLKNLYSGPVFLKDLVCLKAPLWYNLLVLVQFRGSSWKRFQISVEIPF